MDIFINERSFNNQGQPHTINQLMRDLVDTLDLLRTIYQNAEIVVHSTLSSRLIGNNQTLAAWLSTNKDDGEEEDITQPPLQALITVVLAALARSPFVEELLEKHVHICTLNDEDHNDSSIAAAACLTGIVASLADHASYPEGPLTVMLMHKDDSDIVPVKVSHFVRRSEVRKYRRRYVPNPKHHPSRAGGHIAIMELDREYDPFTPQRELELRHPDEDMPDTRCQQLLDGAEPGGKQLYALVYGKNGRDEIFYEFQPDNTNGFHGYPIPESQVPAGVVRELRKRFQK